MLELESNLKSVYNKRLDLVKPSKIRGFDQQISTIDGLIKLTIGEPDLDTPEHVKNAAIKAINNNETHYSAQPGTQELRSSISSYLSRKHQLNYSFEEVLVTVGSTEAIFGIFETIINPGDKIIIPTPAFALYEPIITLLGGKVIELDTSKTDFKLDPEMLENVLIKEGNSVKAILINYPNNPTGVELSEKEIQSLANVIKKYSLFVISDDIYSDLTYDGIKHYSIAKLLPQQTIYVSGVSKSYAMTGWRIGFVAAPQEFIKKLTKVHAFMVTCPSTIDQFAAADALENGDEDIVEMCSTYLKRRNYLYQEITNLGFQAVLPNGAFYLFVKVPDKFGKDDLEFALALAKYAKVGVIPGSAFGKGGIGYIRISYAASLDDIKVALERIKSFVEERHLF